MEFTHNELFGVLGAALTLVLAGAGALARLLIGQFERRLDERFTQQEASRAEAQKLWTAKFENLEQCAQNEAREWQRIERDILTLKADLPLNYVRREDYIRNQTIIEAKIDGLALKIENALLRGEAK